VALTPAVTATLIKQGFNVQLEAGAGAEAKFRDDDFAAAGAKVVDRKAVFNSGT
jgi:H+-translocating NAD(P) transhydrogenase